MIEDGEGRGGTSRASIHNKVCPSERMYQGRREDSGERVRRAATSLLISVRGSFVQLESRYVCMYVLSAVCICVMSIRSLYVCYIIHTAMLINCIMAACMQDRYAYAHMIHTPLGCGVQS